MGFFFVFFVFFVFVFFNENRFKIGYVLFIKRVLNQKKFLSAQTVVEVSTNLLK